MNITQFIESLSGSRQWSILCYKSNLISRPCTSHKFLTQYLNFHQTFIDNLIVLNPLAQSLSTSNHPSGSLRRLKRKRFRDHLLIWYAGILKWKAMASLYSIFESRKNPYIRILYTKSLKNLFPLKFSFQKFIFCYYNETSNFKILWDSKNDLLPLS